MGGSASQPAQLGSQEGKIFVVTGANTGLGFEAAKLLGKAKGRVILACRSEERGKAAVKRLLEEAPEGRYEFMQLDLADLDSVKGFSKALSAQEAHVDVLINNAGVMWPPLEKTKQGFEMQFGTNHLGHFALTVLMLPLLEAAPAGRVVPVSSMAADWKAYAGISWDNLSAEKGYNYHYAYGQSKLANIMFALEFDKRLKAKGSKVQSIAAHPGACNTELLRHSYTKSLGFAGMHPSQGCLTYIEAACSPDAKSGDYYGPHGFIHAQGWPTKVTPPARALNESDTARLWQVSEEMTGVTLA